MKLLTKEMMDAEAAVTMDLHRSRAVCVLSRNAFRG
jgi:hypothetical protein